MHASGWDSRVVRPGSVLLTNSKFVAEESGQGGHNRVVGTFHECPIKLMRVRVRETKKARCSAAGDRDHPHVFRHFSRVAQARETSPPKCHQVRFVREWAIAIRCMCSLYMALCQALLFACSPFSARNAFTLIFTSSEVLPETFVVLVP